jgi:hypothetical protein
MENQENIIVKPVDKKNWLDFESLFQSKGILKACWCMHWRMTKDEFIQINIKENKIYLNKAGFDKKISLLE